MIFKKTKIEGCYIIIPKINKDHRGSFTRYFCKKKNKKMGINFQIKQINISENKKKGTLRGFHYQSIKCSEKKIINCTSGEIYNVVLDMRKESKTFSKWFSINLSSINKKALIVPAGCANAFLTLKDNTFVYYCMSDFYNSKKSKGIKYDDPFFSVKWPFAPKVISQRDKNYKTYSLA
jgi:dTDP-4-dehydrorhamnose 3,5-epimerase